MTSTKQLIEDYQNGHKSIMLFESMTRYQMELALIAQLRKRMKSKKRRALQLQEERA